VFEVTKSQAAEDHVLEEEQVLNQDVEGKGPVSVSGGETVAIWTNR
jgi:hypothetical protein